MKNQILTFDEISALNSRMLGLGAPVEYDGQGYNKPDYQVGIWYAQHGIADAKSAARVAEILLHYRKTQMTAHADALKTALDEYRTASATIRFSGFRLENDGVAYAALQWDFDKAWKNAVATRKGTDGEHWKKTPQGVWEYRVAEKALPDFLKFCQQNGKITDALNDLQYPATKAAAKAAQASAPDVSALSVKISVEENIDFPSVVQVRFSYPVCSREENARLFDAVKNAMTAVKSAYWYAETKSYHIPAFLVRELIPALSASGVTFDTSELLPILDRFSTWGKSHELKTPAPENFTAFPHQLADAATMIKFKRLGNFSEMGTGKTASAIIALASVGGNAVVVTPATVVYNWEIEITKLFPEYAGKTQVLDGKKPISSKAAVIIASYETATRRYSDLLSFRPNCLVMDESHYIKAVDGKGTPTAMRGKALLFLASRCEYVFPMTGTPVVNCNGDLYTTLTALGHSSTIGGFAFRNYMEQYNDTESQRGHTVYTGAKNSDLLYRNIKNYYVRHLRSEVLPDLQKVRTPVYCHVDLSEYDRFVAEYLRKRETEGAEALVALGKARESIAILKAQTAAKMARDMVETGEKVVLFVNFETEKNVITGYLDKAKISYVEITGKVSKKARQAAKEAFQTDENCKVAVVSFGAGAEGQTLTAACNLIVTSYPWTVAKLTQGEDRICRAGQKRACTIHLLTAIGADIDVKMTCTLTRKGALASDVIDDGRGDRCNLVQLITGGKDSGKEIDDMPENF